jgi:exosome complex exonuclease RRP6
MTVKSITAEDVAFQRTADPEFGRELDVQMSRLLGLANDLLASAAGVCGVKAPRPLEDAEDINLNWRGIVDVLDSLKEKVDTTLDEYTGLRKKKEGGLGGSTGEPGSSSSSAATAAQQTQKKPRPSQLDRNIRFANVVKPQLAFERRPDNFPQEPWKPLLTSKPHATVPLGQSLVQFKEGASRSQYAPKPHRSYRAFLKSAQAGAKDAVKSTDNERGRQRGKRKRRKRRRTNKRFRFKHPYEAEIVNMTYPEKVSSRADPIMYQPVETTTAKWVDTFEGVLEMLEELKKVDEIAVDLEHHDWRTYFGMVSLMQISTRDKDWIVDTLKPWRHRLEVLNEVFANPAIVKVLHGAHMDVIWLQRDLGLYLVGLFDTFFACDELYPTRSLAYLLKRFVDFDADKKYQMADWRLR